MDHRGRMLVVFIEEMTREEKEAQQRADAAKLRLKRWPRTGFVIAEAETFLATYEYEPISIAEASSHHEVNDLIRSNRYAMPSDIPHYWDALLEFGASERLPDEAWHALMAHLRATFDVVDQSEPEVSWEEGSRSEERVVKQTEWGQKYASRGPPPIRGTLH